MLLITSKRLVGALALAGALTLGTTSPAPALSAGVGGITGSITPKPGFGGCASLDFSGGTVAGEFTVSAVLLPVGVRAVDANVGPADLPVLVDAEPFVATGSTWSHCFSGAIDYGTATYSLVASGPGGDFAEVLQCRRLSASMSCT